MRVVSFPDPILEDVVICMGSGPGTRPVTSRDRDDTFNRRGALAYLG